MYFATSLYQCKSMSQEPIFHFVYHLFFSIVIFDKLRPRIIRFLSWCIFDITVSCPKSSFQWFFFFITFVKASDVAMGLLFSLFTWFLPVSQHFPKGVDLIKIHECNLWNFKCLDVLEFHVYILFILKISYYWKNLSHRA